MLLVYVIGITNYVERKVWPKFFSMAEVIHIVLQLLLFLKKTIVLFFLQCTFFDYSHNIIVGIGSQTQCPQKNKENISEVHGSCIEKDTKLEII